MTGPERNDEQAKLALARDERMPVGVILERRTASNPWDDFVWRAVAIVPGAATTPAWSVVREAAETTQFFAGTFALELHPKETMLYRENLMGRTPSAYVVLVRDPAADPHGIVVRHVTVSPGDAEAYMDAESAVEAVPLPEIVQAWLHDYVAAFHVEEVFRKRKRKPFDPRKGIGRGSGSSDHEPSDG
jgi:hypothetical protein